MFMNPRDTLVACNLQSTDIVADFGAGSGFMSRAASALVPQGHVYAIEINREIVARLIRDATDGALTNIHPLWGDIELPGGSKLDDGVANFVIISNILFHLDDKDSCMKEAWRVLKSGGRILVVDWTESFGGIGPAPHHVVPQSVAEALATHAGFIKVSDTIPAGEHHYAILFRKP